MSTEPLHYRGIGELAAQLARRELSPVDLVTSQLERINALDVQLRSYCYLTVPSALDAARQAEEELFRGECRGPLHGIPIALKDLVDLKGAVTGAGTKLFANRIATEDATVAQRLKQAGAIVLGKLQLTEAAFGSHHPDIPVPINPWGAAYWSGVSSSGCGVATAAGLCHAAVATDTGGSIRWPSAANGLTGLKPSFGLISTHGVFPCAPSLDTVGTMARSAYDCAGMLQAMSGQGSVVQCLRTSAADDLGRVAAGLRGLRVGVDDNYNFRSSDRATVESVQAAIAACGALGAELVSVKVPQNITLIADIENLAAAEAALVHEVTYPVRASEYGEQCAAALRLGRALSAFEFQKILERRRDLSHRMNSMFDVVDLLVTPVQAFAAPTVEYMQGNSTDRDQLEGLARFTCPFNMTGHPTITLPARPSSANMPIGFQIVAPYGGEQLLLNAAMALQSATDWHLAHPPI